MPERQKKRMLKVELDPTDERFAEQLAASLQRIETGLTGMTETLETVAQRASEPLRLNVSGPEPAWLVELRKKLQQTRDQRGTVLVVPASSIANVLALIDERRRP